MNKEKLLRHTLTVNALTSMLSVIPVWLWNQTYVAVNDLAMGLPWLYALQMIPFGIYVLYQARREELVPKMIYPIIVIDILWVWVHLGRVLLEPGLSSGGIMLILVLSGTVSVYAVLQTIGVWGLPKRMPAMVMILVSAFVFSSCSTYDLRSHATITVGDEALQAEKAHSILNQSITAHGWDQVQSGQFAITYTDSWPVGWLRALFHPWPSHEGKIRQQFPLADLYSSQVEFLDGVRKGEIWGMENKQTFVIREGEKSFRKHNNTAFYLPTYQYFAQMPYWLQDVPLVEYAGERETNGQTYDLIFGSWDQLGPQQEVDQYLYWINQETKLLERVEYTIREQFGGAHGVNTFSDFRAVDGLVVPFLQTITSAEDERIVHQLQLHEFAWVEE
jgi:hypothetical protein